MVKWQILTDSRSGEGLLLTRPHPLVGDLRLPMHGALSAIQRPIPGRGRTVENQSEENT